MYLSRDTIRTRFSSAMSMMYKQEVPLYGELLTLVARVNARALSASSSVAGGGDAIAAEPRLAIERHGAIRLGTAAELRNMRRLLAVMGMEPVGYYDLSVAGIPVHSTAFRPLSKSALDANPFRLFTSLLRLDLIEDPVLRERAAKILAARRIFSDRLLELLALHDANSGFDSAQADEFVAEALETFRWHGDAPVSRAEYEELHAAHRLIADVVCFHGPHINHLTPRTLDIDAAQQEMKRMGIPAKATIEGPPLRTCPILLRQTSFKALEESVVFADDQGGTAGTHTARFGEIEQRGQALTRTGRALYDELLRKAGGEGQSSQDRLLEVFREFPDDLATIRRRKLGFFRYEVTPLGLAEREKARSVDTLDELIDAGWVSAEPIVYEDFLPVSAAGIFQSNLGEGTAKPGGQTQARGSQAEFEAALGAPVHDEFALYETEESRSLAEVARILHKEALQ